MTSRSELPMAAKTVFGGAPLPKPRAIIYPVSNPTIVSYNTTTSNPERFLKQEYFLFLCKNALAYHIQRQMRVFLKRGLGVNFAPWRELSLAHCCQGANFSCRL
jgi:hypothetical protein